MSEKTPEKNASTTAEDARGEEAYVVRPELVQEIHHALATANIRRVEERVGALHHADLADLIEMLAPEDRKILIEIIRAEFDPETLATLEEHVREEVIEQLGAADVAPPYASSTPTTRSRWSNIWMTAFSRRCSTPSRPGTGRCSRKA